MGVPCPRCGRSYDVALFQYGRTLHCTCGSRVRHAARWATVDAPAPRGSEPLRFAADAMLGRLAIWLRLLGVDCTWRAEVADSVLVRHALEEGRVLLTRDRSLLVEWSVPSFHLFRAGRADAQLLELADRFDLADSLRPLSRCSRCNAPLVPIEAERVRGRVPANVLAGHRRFQTCRVCSRVYWEGSHAERIRTMARRLTSASR